MTASITLHPSATRLRTAHEIDTGLRSKGHELVFHGRRVTVEPVRLRKLTDPDIDALIRRGMRQIFGEGA